MKYAIISSKDLGPDCWSPKRFLNSCEDCDQIKKCKLPEAIKGQIKLLNNKINEAENNTKKWRQEKNDLKNKLP